MQARCRAAPKWHLLEWAAAARNITPLQQAALHWADASGPNCSSCAPTSATSSSAPSAPVSWRDPLQQHSTELCHLQVFSYWSLQSSSALEVGFAWLLRISKIVIHPSTVLWRCVKHFYTWGSTWGDKQWRTQTSILWMQIPCLYLCAIFFPAYSNPSKRDVSNRRVPSGPSIWEGAFWTKRQEFCLQP